MPDLPANWRDGIATMRGHLDELRDTLREVADDHYEGVDPTGRCRVRVDGTGLLVAVDLDGVATRLDGAEVAALVMDAVAAADAARAELMAARLTAVTNRIRLSGTTGEPPR